MGRFWWISTRESTYRCRRCRKHGFTPGLGWSPGEGSGNPLQYSCLGNSMDRGAWRLTVRGLQRAGPNWVSKQQQYSFARKTVLPHGWFTEKMAFYEICLLMNGWQKRLSFNILVSNWWSYSGSNSLSWRTQETGALVLIMTSCFDLVVVTQGDWIQENFILSLSSSKPEDPIGVAFYYSAQGSEMKASLQVN